MELMRLGSSPQVSDHRLVLYPFLMSFWEFSFALLCFHCCFISSQRGQSASRLLYHFEHGEKDAAEEQLERVGAQGTILGTKAK